ncbi:MAG: hypothetical protein LBQ94_02850 [Treponema sp.]|jgi:hypothetical protein|nr:hypothetical protein [Treponema sp.]
MKKYSIFGMLAMALVFCLVFAACKNDTPSVPTKFEGEWYNTDHNNPLKKDYFKFTGDSFEHRQYNSNGVPSSTVRGTFDSDETAITFSYSGQTLMCQYELDTVLKDLVIEPGNTIIAGGIYGGRRDAASDNDFAGTWKCLYAADADGVNYDDFSYVFTGGKSFSFKTTHPDSGDIILSGTFSYTPSEITFTPQPVGAWTGYKATYHFEGSKILWINALPAQHPELLFVKQ